MEEGRRENKKASSIHLSHTQPTLKKLIYHNQLFMRFFFFKRNILEE